MRKNTKDRQAVLKQPFLNQHDIQILLKMPRTQARKVFLLADKVDEDFYQDRRIYQNKVRTTTVLKIVGVQYSFLERICHE